MKQDYRLLVLDLDGTLTNSKKEISPRNLRTLLRLQQSGVRLVLASGRPTYGIVPLAEQLQMKENNFYLSYGIMSDKMRSLYQGSSISFKTLPDSCSGDHSRGSCRLPSVSQ
jgi:HAD superfamily hydrolase (TIGR01484 family)